MVGQESLGKSRGQLVDMIRVVGVGRPVARMERLGTRRRSGDHGGQTVVSDDGLERGRPREADLRPSRSLGLVSSLSEQSQYFLKVERGKNSNIPEVSAGGGVAHLVVVVVVDRAVAREGQGGEAGGGEGGGHLPGGGRGRGGAGGGDGRHWQHVTGLIAVVRRKRRLRRLRRLRVVVVDGLRVVGSHVGRE